MDKHDIAAALEVSAMLLFIIWAVTYYLAEITHPLVHCLLFAAAGCALALLWPGLWRE